MFLAKEGIIIIIDLVYPTRKLNQRMRLTNPIGIQCDYSKYHKTETSSDEGKILHSSNDFLRVNEFVKEYTDILP